MQKSLKIQMLSFIFHSHYLVITAVLTKPSLDLDGVRNQQKFQIHARLRYPSGHWEEPYSISDELGEGQKHLFYLEEPKI